jgi:hypothetical protein
VKSRRASFLRRIDDAINKRVVIAELSITFQRRVATVTLESSNGVWNRMVRIVTVKGVAGSEFAVAELNLELYCVVAGSPAIIANLEYRHRVVKPNEN